MGSDAGPGSIQWHLGRRRAELGVVRVPAEATIWRILTRRGFVIPEPRKRPKSSLRRFEASAPNEMWQTDATKWTIQIGQVEILTFLDDHSRRVARSRAVLTATTDNTWETFLEAVAVCGLPSGVLSDNGLNFSGRLRGFEVAFEINLRAGGVRPITSRPYHPQTCGKIERFHQTLKKWLAKKPMAADLDELQTQLDEFVVFYNTCRPHRGIGRVTPQERWDSRPALVNAGHPLPNVQRAIPDHHRSPRPGHHPPLADPRRQPLQGPTRPRHARRHPRRRVHQRPTRPPPPARQDPQLPAIPAATPTMTVRDVPRHQCQTCRATQQALPVPKSRPSETRCRARPE